MNPEASLRPFFILCVVALWALAVGVKAQSADDSPQRGLGTMREVPAAAKAFSRGTAPPPWAAATPNLPQDVSSDGLVMLFWESHFRVAPEPTTLVHRVYQVNQAASLGDIGQLQIQFNPEYQRIELHALRVVRRGERVDRTASVNVRFLQRERELEAGVLTGDVTASAVLDDLRVGDIVELTYSLIGQNPVFDGKFVAAAGWDGGIAVRWRRVVLDLDAARAVRYRVIGAGAKDAPQPRESREAGRRILLFEGHNLPAVEADNFIPRDVHPYRWIQFSEFESWQEVARWAAALFAGGDSAAVLQPIIAAMRTAADPRDAVVKALDFVQSEVRYLSVALGENSHRPVPPEQVLTRRYGDCKDKSWLLTALLRGLGIEATPVFLSLQYGKGVDQLLPSPAAFDHAIVRATVAGRTYYLDPTLTSQAHRIERVGQVHAGTRVLVVSPRSSALESIPQEDAPPRTVRSERVEVASMNGPAMLDLRYEHTGRDAESVRASAARMTEEQLRKAYEGVLHRRYPGAGLVQGPRIEDDRRENRITFSAQYQLPKFLELDGERWLARFRADNLVQLFFTPENASRRHPLAVPSYPSVNRYEFEVILPEGIDVDRRPEHRSIQGAVFTAEETLSFSGRAAKLIVEARISGERVEPADTVAFLESLRKYYDTLGGAIIVARNDVKTAASVSLPLRQAVTEQLEKTVKTSAELLRDARLGRERQADVLCERARALAFLGRAAEAAGDIAEALRQHPSSPWLLKCSGEVHFVLGNFARSTPDLSRALALGAQDSDIHFLRGLSQFYLGKLDEAASDFTQAAAAALDPATRLRMQTWHMLALRRAKPASNAPERAEPAGSDWPAPALALFRNQQTPEDVLREAHRESGDRLDIALSEAYLYIGQHYLLAGDRIRATAYLQRAVDKGVLHAFHHAAARHELARLAGSSR